MAFNPSNTRTSAPANTNNSGFVEAGGFINVELHLPNQPVLKLPSMALQESKAGNLLTWLNEDPTRVTKLLQYIKFDYKQNVKTAKVFDFSKL